MRKNMFFLFILLVIASLILTGCSSTAASLTTTATQTSTSPTTTTSPPTSTTKKPPTTTPPHTTTTTTTTTTSSVIPANTPGGVLDPDIVVDIYQPDKAWSGTTLLTDNHNPLKRRIIEVNMLGEIVWEYIVPGNTQKSFVEADLLPDNNILYTLSGMGVYEIDRSGNIVWQYLTGKIDHDADRLPNGNTIFVFGMYDQKSDAQVTEVNSKGEIVWQWYARDYFDVAPYDTISGEGWAHTNAVSRLDNGNTLISPRNFNLVVEVAPDGHVVAKYGEGFFFSQHDPYFLPNGNILFVQQGRPNRAVEYNPVTCEVVWQSPPAEQSDVPVRDANRLPNGNTLITTATRVIEVTTEGEIVWQLKLKDISFTAAEAAGRGFYKAERICTEYIYNYH